MLLAILLVYLIIGGITTLNYYFFYLLPIKNIKPIERIKTGITEIMKNGREILKSFFLWYKFWDIWYDEIKSELTNLSCKFGMR